MKTMQTGAIEWVLRQHMSKPGNMVAEAAGWDSGNVNRFLSGVQGVPINKIDALVSAVGFVLVSRKYLDAIGTLSEVGANCHCARAGAGECGAGRTAGGMQAHELHFHRAQA